MFIHNYIRWVSYHEPTFLPSHTIIIHIYTLYCNALCIRSYPDILQ